MLTIFVHKSQLEKYDVKVRRKAYYEPNGIPISSKRTLHSL